MSDDDRVRLWTEAESGHREVVGLEALARLKMTRREKDYAVIGELARRMGDPVSQLLFSRSSRDLLQIAQEHQDALAATLPRRPLLARVGDGRAALEEALDRERRELMRADEERLRCYAAAAEGWASLWPEVTRKVAGLPLPEAHRIMSARAEAVLPFVPEPGDHR